MKRKEFVIRLEKRYCPFCDEEHEVKLIKIKQKATIKNCEVDYDEILYYCEQQKEEFEDGELLDLNLLSIRDAYRFKNNLLTCREIKGIRDKYKLTQEDLSNILGLGEKTITRYETTTIQERPYDILLRKFNEDYNFAYDMLLKAKDKFKNKKFLEIKDTITGFILINNERSIQNELKLKNLYIREDVETTRNGMRLLQLDKIKSMMAFFATYTNTKKLFTVKLMKLLWYADAISYLKLGKSMTGLMYQHMPNGALPVGFREIVELDSVDKEQVEFTNEIGVRFYPKKVDMVDVSLFTKEELIILHKVCDSFKEFTGSTLSRIMHNEKVYQLTEQGEYLDFSLIKEIKAIKI